MPSLQSVSDSDSDRARERWGEEDDEEYDTEEERGDMEEEGEGVVGLSRLSRGTAISDATSPTPVIGEPVSPVLSSSTAAGPGASTDEPDDLPQLMGPARSSPSSIERESLVTTPNTPDEPATPPQAEHFTTGSYFGPLGEIWDGARAIVLSEAPEQKVEEVAVPRNGDASDQNIPDPFPDPTASELDPSHSDESNLVPRDASADEKNTPVMSPIPQTLDDAGQPQRSSIQEAASTQSIDGFDTSETPPPHLPENAVHQQPLAAYPDYITISPSEGIPMDCGMLPSRIDPPGQGSSRRRIASPQGPEQGKAGGGNGQTQVGWVVPFSVDSRLNNARQQTSRESPDRVVMHDLRTSSVSPHISPLGLGSSSSGHDFHLYSPANPRRSTTPPIKPPPHQEDQPFHAHGWIEYSLPDESLYYVHHGYQVVVDMDLSDEGLLSAVTTYLEDHDDVIPPGQEFWLRETGSREGGFVPRRWLVDHSKQSVAFKPSEADGDGEPHHADDRLDTKYRYWSFIEAHPAHTSLPPGAYRDAMDALNWASANELLPLRHSTPPPFTLEECRNLNAFLQSIDQQGETPLRTHTISRILLRSISWRQSHFRAGKPLPADVGYSSLCRTNHSTPIHSSALMLMIVMYACLVAAITLFPAQDFVRIAGIGAILILLFPVVSNVVAAVQSKTDSGSSCSHCARSMFTFSLKGHILTGFSTPPPGQQDGV